MRNLQEIEELESCAVQKLKKAKQLRKDGISIQVKESQSTVNQLTVQIQELQDKVNSLSDAREFYDPETASSSRLSHDPSHPTRIPSPHGMLSRHLCLQPDTRNSIGISGNAAEDLPAPNEPSAAFFGNS